MKPIKQYVIENTTNPIMQILDCLAGIIVSIVWLLIFFIYFPIFLIQKLVRRIKSNEQQKEKTN